MCTHTCRVSCDQKVWLTSWALPDFTPGRPAPLRPNSERGLGELLGAET